MTKFSVDFFMNQIIQMIGMFLKHTVEGREEAGWGSGTVIARGIEIYNEVILFMEIWGYVGSVASCAF